MITHLIVLSSTLLTAHQQAVTGRTNGQAIISHIEQVRRVQVTAEKTRFHKPKNFATNIILVSERRWQEAVQDLTPVAPAPAPAPAPAKPVASAKPSLPKPVASTAKPSTGPVSLPPRSERQKKAQEKKVQPK